MARGGKRSGAGRKRGSKDRYDKTIAAAAVETGQTPLDIMLHVARTAILPGRKKKVSPQLQLYAAKEAAAYCHAKLQAIALTQTPPLGDARPWNELEPLEKIEMGRRLAFVLREAGTAADELATQPPAPPEPPRLPFRPQPELEPRVERPEPISEHAVEILPTPWPVPAWERAARVNLAAIPEHLRPEMFFDGGGRPVPLILEAPAEFRKRLATAGFDLERATLKVPFAEPQRSSVRPQVVTRRP